MKHYLKSFLLFGITAALSVVSCGKYEDGPNFSLRSKEARLVNTWVIEKTMQDGVDNTAEFKADNPEYQLELKKDNSFVSSTYDSLLSARDENKGKWKLTNNKEEIELTDDLTGQQISEKILRLTNTELWTELDFGIVKIEIHYKQK